MFETDEMTTNWYQACMNETRIEELGLEPLINSLTNLGGWPALDKKEKDYESFKWYEQVRRLNREGHSIKTIMNHDIDVDNKNSSKMVFRLGQPNLGLNPKYLINGFNNRNVQNYYQYMVDAAVFLGGNKSRVMYDLKRSLLFEIEMAKLLASKEERRGPNKFFVPVTIKELDDDRYELNGISQPQSWLDHIKGLLNDASVFSLGNSKYMNGGIDITKDEVIIIRNPDYFVNVLKLINQTDPRVVANYMGWRVVMESLGYLNTEAREIRRKYERSFGLNEGVQTRWIECIESAGFNQFMYDKGAGAAGSMYVRKYFKRQQKESVSKIVQYIRKSFKSMIDDSPWMDDETKINAKKKLNNMKEITGYLDELLDDDLMKKLHKGMFCF